MIGLIIIFQPEIRKIFERTVSLKKKGILKEEYQLSRLISDVVFKLVDQKKGAIFIFPCKDLIKPWISEGIALNASPSIPLLLSIFDTHSPGHDGAVVIENGLVASFAVRLPLSNSNKLPEEFGTRHFAGLGLSEQTDALVIVVSEEKGTISVFRDGHFKIISRKEDLASQILNRLESTTSYPGIIQKGNKRKKTFLEMAGSFILAFIFWSTVVLTQSQLQEVAYTIPIEYRALPGDMTFIEEKNTEVKIVLLGLSSDFMKMDVEQLKIHIDLSKMSQGSHAITVSTDNILLPEGIKLIACDPSVIEFTLRKI